MQSAALSDPSPQLLQYVVSYVGSTGPLLWLGPLVKVVGAPLPVIIIPIIPIRRAKWRPLHQTRYPSVNPLLSP